MHLYKVPVIPAANLHLVVLFGTLCLSHWQQDVEEADTSAICNKTLSNARSNRPLASRECVLLVQLSLIKVCLLNTVTHSCNTLISKLYNIHSFS